MHALSDLRQRPDVQAVVADRLWTAWWRAEGSSLDAVAAMVKASLGPGLVPTSFVAHDADQSLDRIRPDAGIGDRREDLAHHGRQG